MAILQTHKVTVANVDEIQVEPTKDEQPSRPIFVKVSKKVDITPYLQHYVLDHTTTVGLIYFAPLSARTWDSRSCRVIAANAEMNVEPTRYLNIIISNFSASEVELPKGMNIAVAEPLPACIIQTGADTTNTCNVKDVPIYKEPKFRPRFDRHEHFRSQDNNFTTRDWRDYVQIGHKYDSSGDELTAMLKEFKTMWDGQLGRINIDKHRITLTAPETRPFHFAPYRVRFKGR